MQASALKTTKDMTRTTGKTKAATETKTLRAPLVQSLPATVYRVTRDKTGIKWEKQWEDKWEKEWGAA
eukprot:3763294-Ditylum_brightwellii.AAC.1